MQTGKIDGKFTRISSSQLAKKINPPELSDKIEVPPGWFVISHRWMEDKQKRRLNHGRAFKIKTKAGKCVYRILRFSPNLKGSSAEKTGEIVLDWPAWLKLCDYDENVPDELDLTIEKFAWWDYPKMVQAHPDPIYRLALLLGLLSVVLAVLSIALAI